MSTQELAHGCSKKHYYSPGEEMTQTHQSVGERINKTWYILSVRYSAMKRNQVPLRADVDEPWKQSGRSQTQGSIYKRLELGN